MSKGFIWKAASDDGCYEDKSANMFETQAECYADMMKHAVDKIKWNVEWEDVIEGQHYHHDDGVLKTHSYIGYDVKFFSNMITHTSYSGTYTWRIESV